MAPAFGCAADFALGVEDELLLVEPDTRGLSHGGPSVVAAAEVRAGEIKEEFYAALVELATPICRDAADAARSLADLRSALWRTGASAIGVGVHPTAVLGDVEVTPRERYRHVHELLGAVVRRTPEAALHVHVSVPDEDTAICVFNGLREHIPLLQALSANSPYLHGQDSGWASIRTFQNDAYPRYGVPRAFRDWGDYTDAVDAVLVAGEFSDYTAIWWQLRPHPTLGTVETRIMDSQASLGAVAGIAALVQGIALAAADKPVRSPTPPEALAESSFRAARFGLDARLLSDGRMLSARDIAMDLVSAVRPRLEAASSEDALEEIERIVRDGNGADRQRAAHVLGGIGDVLDWLVRETAAGSGP